MLIHVSVLTTPGDEYFYDVEAKPAPPGGVGSPFDVAVEIAREEWNRILAGGVVRQDGDSAVHVNAAQVVAVQARPAETPQAAAESD